MWQVIRKAQGLPLNEDPSTSLDPAAQYEHNQRCILLHEARPNVPYLDPKTMTRGYGNLHYERVRRWLLDEDPHLRLQAADQLVELYTEKREHRATSLRYDTLPILFAILCGDEEEVLRERAATALEMLVRETAAQKLLLQSARAGKSAKDPNPLRRLLKEALQDPCDGVVVLALRVLVACHAYVNNFAMTERLVHLGAVPTVLALVERSSNPHVRAVACTALVPMFDVKEAHILFQRGGGMATTTDAVRGAEDDMLVAAAAEVISHAAEWPQGKRDAVRCATMAALLPYIASDNLTVRVAVVAALAQITVWEPAKFQALESDAMTVAVSSLLVDEDERDVIAHLGKLIYHLAEHPAGRAALRPCKPRLAELLSFADGDDLSVRLTLQNAIEILSRK